MMYTGMRIEPEQMLKQNRIAAQVWDRKYQREEIRSKPSRTSVIAITGVPTLGYAGGIVGPNKQGQRDHVIPAARIL